MYWQQKKHHLGEDDAYQFVLPVKPASTLRANDRKQCMSYY